MDKKQYVVIGLGRFGTAVAKTLYELNNDVLAIDSNEKIIQEISEYVTHAISTNATDEDSLKSLGISNFDVAVIGIGVNMEDSIMATLLAKELGVKYVIAKANTNVHAKILYKIGADKVVFPERDTGIRVAQDMVSSSILDYIDLSSEYGIAEIIPSEQWNDKTLEQLNLRASYGINIVAIKRSDDINIAPTPDYKILKGDIIVAIGKYKHLNKLDVIGG
ncbi:potassium channel family protein [Clostridium thailandense]|uniref:TrkA family potassium uptake protein n=1 Tax=Clostridium thailandense TaxID=2794346 RepID=A0A949WQI6_9CLOT|nr:TrkA family potassium uptake protein [Clostridium thailandense]MBV7272795.1 TrkA family potassium uptake protein [Clostridium thailandense]MCH5137664.1 TrkA family potassium uptake protein [Clostridiaceae bacterium UIB06]